MVRASPNVKRKKYRYAKDIGNEFVQSHRKHLEGNFKPDQEIGGSVQCRLRRIAAKVPDTEVPHRHRLPLAIKYNYGKKETACKTTVRAGAKTTLNRHPDTAGCN